MWEGGRREGPEKVGGNVDNTVFNTILDPSAGLSGKNLVF
jgi:hypothetical protein